jgi:two-component sensor histidine kinase
LASRGAPISIVISDPPAASTDSNEAARVKALRRYDILDTPPDGSFDHVAAIAASLFDVPIAIVSLVDEDRIWFKARHGIDVDEIERRPGLCASAIMQSDPYVLTDASCDPRSLANPLVAGEFGLRFYVAAPLRTSDGHNLGTLCVIDQKPRSVTEGQIAQLEALAGVIMDQMELRMAARNAVADLKLVIEQKEAALARSSLLAREIDHRVMNSLQQVSALLSLQSRDLEGAGAEQIKVASGRVGAVARVHQHIYQTGNDETFGCLRYLDRLCGDLSSMMVKKGSITVSGSEAELPVEIISPIGLAVNELVTNAVKSGAGIVEVKFERTDDRNFQLAVSDDGNGLPDGFDPNASGGLGMKVVKMLSRQLGGTLSFGRSDTLGGASIAIRFPHSRIG